MTSTTSVGTGLASGLAREFHGRYGSKASIHTLTQWARSKQLPLEDVEEMQRYLSRFYGMGGVVGKIALPTREEMRVGTKVASRISEAKGTPRRGPEKYFLEGIGYADDSDGRGGGVSGGSYYSEYANFGHKPNPDVDAILCPYCKSPSTRQIGAQWHCDACQTNFGRLDTVRSKDVGEVGDARQTSVMGSVRLPGGPVDTAENAVLRLYCLDPLLIEIDLGGVRTQHNRGSAPEALRHRMSPYGRTFRYNFMYKVLEWLYQRAKPGDEAIFDLDGNDAFVHGKDGFRHISTGGRL